MFHVVVSPHYRHRDVLKVIETQSAHSRQGLLCCNFVPLVKNLMYLSLIMSVFLFFCLRHIEVLAGSACEERSPDDQLPCCSLGFSYSLLGDVSYVADTDGLLLFLIWDGVLEGSVLPRQQPSKFDIFVICWSWPVILL